MSWAWETDEDCLRTVANRHPQIVQWGDVAGSAPEKVASLLDQHCTEQTLIVICGAPPCHDFSNIKGAGALGTSGPEGAKFVQWADWVLRFRKLLKQQSTILVENVVMAAAAQDTLDKCLGLRSFLCDAACWAWCLVRACGGPTASRPLTLRPSMCPQSCQAWLAGESGTVSGSFFPVRQGSHGSWPQSAKWRPSTTRSCPGTSASPA